jgi:ABC-type multidrug transport system fused ATPase/permease subunit
MNEPMNAPDAAAARAIADTPRRRLAALLLFRRPPGLDPGAEPRTEQALLKAVRADLDAGRPQQACRRAARLRRLQSARTRRARAGDPRALPPRATPAACDWPHIARLVARHPRELAACGGFGLTTAGLIVAIPLLLKTMMDEVVLGQPGQTTRAMKAVLPAGLHNPVALLMLLGLAALLLHALWRRSRASTARHAAKVSRAVGARLREDLLAQLRHARPEVFEQRSAGEVEALLVHDVATVEHGVLRAVARIPDSAVTMVLMAAVMFSLSTVMGLLMLTVAPATVLAVRRIERRGDGLKLLEASATTAFQRRAGDLAENILPLKIAGRDAFFAERAAADARRMSRRAALREAVAEGSEARARFLWDIGWMVGQTLSMLLIMAGSMSIGAKSAAGTYQFFFGGAFSEMLALRRDRDAGGTALRRIDAFLGTAREPPGAAAVLRHGGAPALQVTGLTFSYQGASRPALTGLDLSIAPGEHVAVVGASGSGKSTLIQLLLWLRRPSAGGIRVDGADLADVACALRRQTGCVLQQTRLMHATLRLNLTLGRSLDERKILSAIDALGLSDLLASFPDGLDTEIGHDGQRFSGGQRQRIAIARLLLTRPRLVLMDEATSALDPNTERLVLRTLKHFLAGRTVVFTAHRLAAVLAADRVLVLEHGRLVQDGGPRELLRCNGPFRQLFGDGGATSGPRSHCRSPRPRLPWPSRPPEP